MIQYIYFVKCPNCEDEHFDFFDEAKEFALGCLSQKPTITQTEVNRNDFGECIDSCDLGTVWSWEDMMGETDAEPAKSIFTKDDLKLMADGKDPEFDELDNSLDYEESETSEVSPIERKPIPEGMTIEQLVEEMEENEDTVECTWCEELFDKSECRKEVDLGWLCSRCEMAIKSRGETLTFREGSYWDFLDEEVDGLLTESEETSEVNKQTAAEALADKINQKASAEEKAAMLKKIAEQIPPDKVAAVTNDIKSKIKDYNLTEEDKTILKTKTKIDPKLIDKADSILTLINSFLDNVQVSLPVLGAIIDIVHLVVPDEALAAVCPPLGAVLAILSYIPEGIVVSILLDFGITALRGISTLAKDAVVSLADLKDTVKESFSEEFESHLKLCPECGKDTFDIETGICITCGFN